jgi:hypothetical protein
VVIRLALDSFGRPCCGQVAIKSFWISSIVAFGTARFSAALAALAFAALWNVVGQILEFRRLGFIYCECPSTHRVFARRIPS